MSNYDEIKNSYSFTTMPFGEFMDEITIAKDKAKQNYTHNKFGNLRDEDITFFADDLGGIKAEYIDAEITSLDDQLIFNALERRFNDDVDEAHDFCVACKGDMRRYNGVSQAQFA